MTLYLKEAIFYQTINLLRIFEIGDMQTILHLWKRISVLRVTKKMFHVKHSIIFNP